MKSTVDILNESLDVLHGIKQQEVENANKNDENFNAVLNLLEREKTEKSKSDNLLEENRKTLDLAIKGINDLKTTTFKTEIGKESLYLLSNVSNVFKAYVEEKLIENELSAKLDKATKELKDKEESLTNLRKWFWAVTIILIIVIVILCVTR